MQLTVLHLLQLFDEFAFCGVKFTNKKNHFHLGMLGGTVARHVGVANGNAFDGVMYGVL